MLSLFCPAYDSAYVMIVINKKFGFFSGLIGGAVAYGFVQITNAQNGATAGSNSSPKVVNAATTVIKSAK